MNIDEAAINRIPDEVGTDVDMLHFGVGLWIVAAEYCSLVVAVKWGGMLLWEAEFVEQGAEP